VAVSGRGRQDGGTDPHGAPARLRPFAPDLAVEWLRDTPDTLYQGVEATLAFVDISGFTALTERLARQGKAGAEEVSDLIGGCFTELLDIGYEYGAEMLKWGGDAALVMFREPGSAARACRAAWLMCETMERVGRLRTSAGKVTLLVSIGVHRGRFDFYLLGDSHRELVVTGPAASHAARMEAAADAGQVVLSPETARELADGLVGGAVGDGRLLLAAPVAEPNPRRSQIPLGDADITTLFPPPTLAHLLGGGEGDEHRHAAVAFIEFSGVDDLCVAEGPEAVTASLARIVRNAQVAAANEGVTFHATDLGADGGKILVLGGIPVVRGNDEERVLRAALSVVGAGGGRLELRAGVNAGRVFMHESGPAYRRIHSFAGDAVNLAARVMGKAQYGEVLATAAVLDHTRSTFDTRPLEPFMVKGKSEPVEAFAVESVRMGAGDQSPSASERAFVGREHELSVLVDAARTAGGGCGSVVEIVAEPGMGKSVLVAQAAASWPLRTFHLACEEYGRSTPYLPVRWLLRAMLGLSEAAAPGTVAAALVDAVRADAPGLLPWLPLLGDVLDVPVRATAEVEALETQYLRARLEETVVAFVAARRREPTAFVFEDAHDIDDASRGLLQRLASIAGQHPWLVVVTRRPEGEEPFGADPPPRQLVVLTPLPESAAVSLLDAVAEELALTAVQRDALVERAGGNPLFIHELAEAALASGTVEELPDRLEPLLAAKVDRLQPGERQVLRAAAVLGIRFDPGILAELLDETPVAGARLLDDAFWRSLGEYVVDDTGGTRRFAHALVRDAAYEGLSFRRRRDLHGRAADAIARRSAGADDQADLLSLHSLHAERFEAAWHFGRVAGERALAVYANADAVTAFSRALDAARRLRDLDRADVRDVAEALGDAAEQAGCYDVARDGYARARRLCTSPVDRARLLRKHGSIHERQAHYSEALRWYTRGRRLVTADPGPAGAERAELAIAYAGVRFRQGRLADCVDWCELAASEAARAGNRPGLAHALYLQDMARSDMALEPGGHAQRALAIYEELGDLGGQGNVFNNLGRHTHQRGRWAEALDWYRRAYDVWVRIGDVVGEATLDYNIGEILSDQGHYDKAGELLDAARVGWRAANYPFGVAVATSSLGRQALRTGDVERADALLSDARERFEAIGSAYYSLETESHHAEALVLGGRGQACDAAEAFILHAAGHNGMEFLMPKGHRLLGVARAAAGDVAGAREELDRSVELALSVGADYELALCLAARAVVGDTAGGHDVGADTAAATELFARLGVVDTPVTSIDDRWPDGPMARRLSGRD
jgi:class 3 adenylate cyclase/tetratricopeptide (TPR) repeat protein